MCRTIAGLALACALVGCSNKKDESTPPTPPGTPGPIPQPGPTPQPIPTPEVNPFPGLSPVAPDLTKVDFTLTAEEYSKEFQTSSKAAEQKYNLKKVEISGTVDYCVIDDDFSEISFTGPAGRQTSCRFLPKEAEKEQGLRGLSRGQRVTVRGVGVGGAGVWQAKITHLGTSTAKPMTFAELVEVLEKTEKLKDYKDRSVLVRVKVVEAGSKEKRFAATVTDPDTGNKKITLRTPVAYDMGFEKNSAIDEVLALKPGEVVLVLADTPTSDLYGLSLENPRILKEPPAGVKLPGDKK